MKKMLLMMTMICITILSSCTDVSLKYLDFDLLPGQDTIDLGELHVDAGAEAYYGLKKLEVVVILNQVDVTKEGVYDIIYQTTHRDLVQTLVRKVTVKDQTPPVATLNPGVDTILLGDVWEDAGITAYDNSDEEVIVDVLGEVLPAVGRYIITYRVTDSSGLVTEISRLVYVIEND